MGAWVTEPYRQMSGSTLDPSDANSPTWLKLEAPARFRRSATTGEAIGEGTARNFPLNNITETGLFLYWSAEGVVKQMPDGGAQMRNYAGITFDVQTESGGQITYLAGSSNVILTPVGSVAVAYGDLVMSDATTGTDIMKQLDAKQTIWIDQAGTLADTAITIGGSGLATLVSATVYSTGATAIAANVLANGVTAPSTTSATSISLTPPNTIYYGGALNDGDMLLLNGTEYYPSPKKYTIGIALESGAVRGATVTNVLVRMTGIPG